MYNLTLEGSKIGRIFALISGPSVDTEDSTRAREGCDLTGRTSPRGFRLQR